MSPGKRILSQLTQYQLLLTECLFSRTQPPRYDEHMGLHKLLRSLPDLLCNGSQSTPKRHLLDRQHASIPPLLHRHIYRTPNRCGLLSTRLPHRLVPRCSRPFHECSINSILAIIPRSRGVLRSRQRILVLSKYESAEHVFYKE